MFLGYAENHAADVYSLLNLDTHKVIVSRYVRMINKMYGDGELIIENNDDNGKESKSNTDEEENNDGNDSDDGDDVDIDGENFSTNYEESGDEIEDNPRVLAEMKKLAASYNPVATRVVEKANEKSKNMDVVNFMIDLAVFVQTIGIKMELGSGRHEECPYSFREAWDHPNMEKRNK